MARPSYSREKATELAMRTSHLIREITENSGKTAAALEKFFGVADEKEVEGKKWSRWKTGERPLGIETEQKMKWISLGLGWLDPESHWLLDAIATDDDTNRNAIKKSAAPKIERHLREIAKILARANVAPHQLGVLLAFLYIADHHSWRESEFEPPSPDEKAMADHGLALARKNCCLRQIEEQAAKDIEKRLGKIVKILASPEWPEVMEDTAICCLRIGDRLTEVYAAKAA